MKNFVKKILSSILGLVVVVVGFMASIAPAAVPVLTVALIVKTCTSKPKISDEEMKQIEESFRRTLELYQSGEYDEFKRNSLELLKECESLPGKIGNALSGSINSLLGQLYFEERDYISAKTHLQRFVDIFSVISGDENFAADANISEMYFNALAQSYMMLASIAKMDNDWSSCEKYITEFLAIAKQTDNHEIKQTIPMTLVKFGHMASALQNHSKAEELYREFISNKAIYSSYPEFDKLYSEAIFSLIAVCTAQLEFDKALQVYDEIDGEDCLNGLDRVLMRSSSISLISYAYMLMGDVPNGLDIIEDFRAKEIARYGNNSVEAIIANACKIQMNQFAGVLGGREICLQEIKQTYNRDVAFWTPTNIGKYPNEYKAFVEAYSRFLEETNDYSSLDIHSTNLVRLFSTPDKKEESIDATILKVKSLININIIEANTLAFQMFGLIKDDPLYVNQSVELSSLLATIYSELGRTEESREMSNWGYERIINYKLADIQQANPMLYVSVIEQLFHNCMKFGDYNQALSIGEFITNTYQKISPRIATGYLYQALAYRGLSDVKNTIKYGKLALSATENPTLCYSAKELIGYGYMIEGNYEEAEKYFLDILTHSDKTYIELRNRIFEDLACLYARKADYDKAQKYAMQFNGDKSEILLLISWLSNNEQLSEKYIQEYYNNYIAEFTDMQTYLSNSQFESYVVSKLNVRILPSIAASFRENVICAQYAYNAILNFKGISLQTEQNIIQYIRKSNNVYLNSKLDLILNMQSALRRAESNNQREILHEEINVAEIELKRDLAVFDDTCLRGYSISDVSKQLSCNDIAIEIVECRDSQSKSVYTAFILRKDWHTPRIVDLCDANELSNVAKINPSLKIYRIGEHRQTLIDIYYRKGYDLIWSKLEPYINESDNVYFSPDGLLHQINIEVLQDANGRRANEKWNLHRVSSTRELCMEKPAIERTSAALYGGLTYDMDSAKLISQSRATLRAKNKPISRGFVADSTMRAGWSSLPATKKEVDAIEQMLKAHNIKVDTYANTMGNEESFKALSGKKTPIIHLATHGFFYKNDEAKQKDYFKLLNIEDGGIYKPDNSLKRSGLILAGALRAWLGESIPDIVEDGILLAEEIAAMDLTGTDLVVLSACETGLGEITSEGVFGLQRAFKKAGVQTLIMSLWRVDDNATSLFMQTFYKHWLDGKSKHEAFSIAQSTVRDNESYSNPYYWAAFIMLD